MNRNTVLGNDREQEFKYWKNGIDEVLKEKGIDYIDVPFLDHKEKKHPHHAIGCYVNYLEVENLIVLPIFKIEKNKDQEVYNKLREIFPEREIETINYKESGFWWSFELYNMDDKRLKINENSLQH